MIDLKVLISYTNALEELRFSERTHGSTIVNVKLALTRVKTTSITTLQFTGVAPSFVSLNMEQNEAHKLLFFLPPETHGKN